MFLLNAGEERGGLDIRAFTAGHGPRHTNHHRDQRRAGPLLPKVSTQPAAQPCLRGHRAWAPSGTLSCERRHLLCQPRGSLASCHPPSRTNVPRRQSKNHLGSCRRPVQSKPLPLRIFPKMTQHKPEPGKPLSTPSCPHGPRAKGDGVSRPSWLRDTGKAEEPIPMERFFLRIEPGCAAFSLRLAAAIPGPTSGSEVRPTM